MKHVKTAPSTESAGTAVRRIVTRTLDVIGTAVDTVGAAVVLMVALAGAFHFGPEALQLESWDLALVGLAVYGGTKLVQALVVGIADLIDPDQKDGDLLRDAEALVRQIQDDLGNGADTDEVLEVLRESRLVMTLADLMHTLAVRHHPDHKPKGVWDPPLYSATWHLHTVDQCTREL